MGQVHIADAVGVHESTISKMKESEFLRFSQILAACDLKVVPADYRCVDPAMMDALVTMSRTALNKTSEKLVWDD